MSSGSPSTQELEQFELMKEDFPAIAEGNGLLLSCKRSRIVGGKTDNNSQSTSYVEAVLGQSPKSDLPPPQKNDPDLEAEIAKNVQVDSANEQLLECVVRRVFCSSKGDECMLLCPVDTPVQILKSRNFEGWAALNDSEVHKIVPAATYALAKIHLHLVLSGFCYTARGGFCYSEEDILEFRTDDGQEIDGLPPEGIEITCFHQDGTHYMIYTPSDPLLFVAVKDKEGLLQIADDELLDDPAIITAIDEETEFNALVEEESALLETVLGERD